MTITARSFDCAPGISVGPGLPPLVIAGPCVIESEDMCLEIARRMAGICRALELPYVFKASFDKANRTGADSYRGPGRDEGLRILGKVRRETGVPVITDIHDAGQAAPAAEVVDMLQIPAFLCRQTDLLLAAGRTGKPVNVKKAQFLAAEDMASVIAKVESTGNRRILLTERGTTFGYHNLVVDMRGLVTMAGLGVPVVFDGTHSVQLPGGLGSCSGGDRRFVPPLVRAAAATGGMSGVFLEVHPAPDKALCDGPNSLPLESVESLLATMKAIHELVR